VAQRPSIRAAILAAIALAGCGGGGAGGPKVPTVRVALDFTPNAAHAGIFAAAERPPSRDRGARIVIREPSSSTDSLKLLLTGRADLAVLDIHDLGLARERGEDLVGVGALVNRQLAAVIAGPGVRRPRDLEGKRVGVTGLPSDDAVLRAVVEGDGGRFDRVRRVTIGFSAVPSLVAGKVAAVTAFWNVEGVALRARGVRTHEFRLDARGGRYPELVLVTTRAELRAHRDRIDRGVTEIGDGEEAAISEPKSALAAIARAGAADPALVHAQYRVIRPAFLTGVQLLPSSLRHWAAFDVRYRILRHPPDLRRTFDTSLVPAMRP
jgi:NitT/TauT family transport system substrate-binding protein/putative hydroxymethylpyrimidine transport system substrate-binding protein